MDGSDLIVLIAGSSGVTAVLVAIITAIVNKKKLSAEATNIITEAASGVVQRLEAENLRLDKRSERLEEERDELENERNGLKRRVAHLEEKERDRDRRDQVFAEQIRLHLLYDEGLKIRLMDAGIEAPPEPHISWPDWDSPNGPPMRGIGV